VSDVQLMSRFILLLFGQSTGLAGGSVVKSCLWLSINSFRILI